MGQRFFTAEHHNEDVLKKSSSGGMFTAITDAWFFEYGNKAVVYGCILDEKLNAKHIRATDFEMRNKMRGSKYISSNVSGIYKCVAEDIKNGFFVAFSGTPCQIAGLNAYLSAVKTDKNNQLLSVEVICHGVGSNRFFNDYISHLEKRYKSDAVSCSFRAKKRAGKLEDMEVAFSNGKKYSASTTRYDWFYSAYGSYILRPSCYDCRFAKKERVADISIGDNWNGFVSDANNHHSSVIITNSDFGFKWFNKASCYFDYTEKNFEDIDQPNMNSPTPKPQRYDEFWNAYSDGGYMMAQRFLGNNSFKGRLRSFIADIIYKLNLVSAAKAVEKFIKKLIGR